MALVDFNTQRICPSCGKLINIKHNFCKYCGVDLSEIKPIGMDDISREIAITAISDPDPSIRKEAVDTLGDFKEKKVLGVLTWILLNDPNEEVRKEAADEIGDLHHPYSKNILSFALKDQSPKVRKEAIEGLKKLKEKVKAEKMDKGQPEERGEAIEGLKKVKEKVKAEKMDKGQPEERKKK